MTASAPLALKRAALSGGLVVVLVAGVGTLLAAAARGQDPAIPLADQIDASSRELDRLRARIAGHRGRLEELRTQEQAASQGLGELAHEIELVQSLLVGLASREEILQRQSDSLSTRLAEHQARFAVRRSSLARHLRSLYRRHPQQRWQRLVTAQSFSELVTQLRFQSLVARLDTRLVAGIRHQGEVIGREGQLLQAALTGLWEAREEATQERARLELAEAERGSLLRELRAESTREQSDLHQLQAQEKRLRDLMVELEAHRTRQDAGAGPAPAGDLANLAGRLEWPARGDVARGFGRSVHPQYGTVTINNGVAIAAGAGAPVYAVAAGSVVFADHLPGFGECVILDHGAGYYTLYANLGRVFAGRDQEVARGEILAEVAAALPHEQTAELYFEIRQGKTPLDPAAWLRPRP